jgi:hypothetical protein
MIKFGTLRARWRQKARPVDKLREPNNENPGLAPVIAATKGPIGE